MSVEILNTIKFFRRIFIFLLLINYICVIKNLIIILNTMNFLNPRYFLLYNWHSLLNNWFSVLHIRNSLLHNWDSLNISLHHRHSLYHRYSLIIAFLHYFLLKIILYIKIVKTFITSYEFDYYQSMKITKLECNFFFKFFYSFENFHIFFYLKENLDRLYHFDISF